MSNFKSIERAILAQFNFNNKVVPYIEGAPGGGKSALAAKIGREMGIPEENITQFYASLREPVDLLGIPKAMEDTGVNHWFPPAEIARLSHGKHLLIIEELSDATTPMQNALCGLIHDRKIGAVKLSDQCYIIATGNRTKDKSGANRIVSKLGGRVRRYEFQENLDDWCDWALDAGLDIMGIQFLRFRPDLLSMFNPEHFSSPTPRTWEKAMMVPTDLPADLYLESVAGDVGEGAAIEFVAFRRIADKLPNMDVVLMNPATAEIPEDPAVRYAFCGALASRAAKDNFDRVCAVVERLTPEFGVMVVNDAQKLCPAVKSTKAFTNWCVKNSSVML
jgi:hypothetical protein